MRPVSKSTDETSTSAVRSSTAAASRSARDVERRLAAPGRRSRPSSASRSSCRRMVWNSPSVVTSRGRDRSGSADSRRTTSSCVFGASAMPPPASPSSRAKPAAHLALPSRRRGPTCRRRSAPRRATPRCCASKADVGPGLMRVAGQQQALRDAEPRVVRRERVGRVVERFETRSASATPASQLGADRPQIGKQRLVERGPQIVGARAAAGAPPGADGALHHLDVAVAPLLNAFVEIDQPLAEVGSLPGRRGTRRRALPGSRATAPPAGRRRAPGAAAGTA